MVADLAGLRRRLNEFMAENGLKHTRQRAVILESLVTEEGHVSLDELLLKVQQTLPGVGYATVYRAMKLFTEAGVAHERRFGDGQTRYEAAAVEQDHHDHLICVRCGHIFEFEDAVIEQRQREIARAHGMRIVSHRLDIWGECLDPDGCQHAGACTDKKNEPPGDRRL